jgi:Asp-tRNA(Asn)/Glu-tRNA(Gln) amidotransferase A subunit family amidase
MTIAYNLGFELAQDVCQGKVRATKLVERCVASYFAWEPQLHAFAWFNAAASLSKAHEADRIGPDPKRPLHGIPVAVKDIFDTAGVPTEYGSPTFRGRLPRQSAVAVTRLESAGALMFGKTVTAELAYFAPGPTTNPWNPRCTPGGSSMGSAAAVAAGIVPLAVGTQTNGSVIRPAAFCGTIGFKPSAGRLPTKGVLRFSPSLDQLGVFARTVEGAACLAAAIAGDPMVDWIKRTDAIDQPKLAIVRTPEWGGVEPGARVQFDADIAAARAAGASVTELELPSSLAGGLGIHRTIMAFEAHRFVGPLIRHDSNRASPQLLALLDAGAAITLTDYRAARRSQDSLTGQFDEWLDAFDAVATLSAMGEAPGLDTTGDPRCCTRWTLVGAPAVTLPTGLGPRGLPLGIQLVGKLGRDQDLLGVARWFESMRPWSRQPMVSHKGEQS